MKKIVFSLFVLFTVLQSCKTYDTFQLRKVGVGQYSVDTTMLESNTEMEKFILPYKEELDAKMNEVIGRCDTVLEKRVPEGSLANFVADAIMDIAQSKSEGKIDFCASNKGGLRIPSMGAGDITRGSIFELMPFDNALVVLTVDGNMARQVFEKVAEKGGGWSVSENVEMVFDSTTTVINTLLLNGEPLNPQKQYRVLTSDYLANGGDKMNFWSDAPREDLNLLFRDAILQYVEKQNSVKKNIVMPKMGRIQFIE